MNIIINSNSMIPIYEQIMNEIKNMIIAGDLKSSDPLPSVRTLANELKISALTVKKAYDKLEEEGFTATVHGKGTYVTGPNMEMIAEQQKKEIEKGLESLIAKAKKYGLSNDELQELFSIILEDL